MKGFNPSFSQETARTYDNSPRGDEAETVAFLARFGKHALEFAVGTGRAYSLVYLVYNTITNLLTRTARSAASRTRPATSRPAACS